MISRAEGPNKPQGCVKTKHSTRVCLGFMSEQIWATIPCHRFDSGVDTRAKDLDNVITRLVPKHEHSKCSNSLRNCKTLLCFLSNSLLALELLVLGLGSHDTSAPHHALHVVEVGLHQTKQQYYCHGWSRGR